MATLEEVREKLKEFNIERDWDKFHNPKDLVLALAGEVGELVECYRWLDDDEVKRVHENPSEREKIEDEIGDIMVYLLILSYKTGIDVLRAAENKIEKNRKRFSVDKTKGVHSNPILGYKGKD